MFTTTTHRQTAGFGKTDMTKIKVIILAAITLHICILARGGTIAEPISKGEYVDSPHGGATCFVGVDEQDRNTLQVRFSNSQTITLWKFVRSVGVSWSPNANFLAVDDYLDRTSTAVLIFRIDYTLHACILIYQTPYSNSVFDQFHVAKWVDDGSQIVISNERRKSRHGGNFKVNLRDKPEIEQSIYR